MIEELDLQPYRGMLKKLKKNENKFPDEQPSHIFRNSVKITCGGKLIALFLKPKDNLAPIPDHHYKPALKTLDAPWKMFPWHPSKGNGRPMVKQLRVGGDLIFGFLKPRSGREDYFHAPTRDELPHAMMLGPLVGDLEAAMREHLPAYYKFHMYQAQKLVLPPDEIFIQKPWKVGDPFQRWQLEKLAVSGFAHFPGGKAFSTLTLNKNILFGAHDDGNNMPHTFSCITALGDFVGGELCFPRFGIGFDVQPHDVLISDTNDEFHCSSRVVVGKRYSIVAYLQGKLDRGWRMVADKATGEVLGLTHNKSWIGSIDWWMKHRSNVYSPVPVAEWEEQKKFDKPSRRSLESFPLRPKLISDH